VPYLAAPPDMYQHTAVPHRMGLGKTCQVVLRWVREPGYGRQSPPSHLPHAACHYWVPKYRCLPADPVAGSMPA
jgi:hypothetical protein